MELQNYHSLLNRRENQKLETFSYLADMNASEIRQQIQSILDNEWDVAIEHAEPERSNKTYWYMWKLPLFGEWDIDIIMKEVRECTEKYPDHHVKIIGYDSKRQTQGLAMVVRRAGAK